VAYIVTEETDIDEFKYLVLSSHHNTNNVLSAHHFLLTLQGKMIKDRNWFAHCVKGRER